MKKGIKIIVGVIIGIAFLSYIFGGGVEKQAINSMNQIEKQVALDSEKQYEIAKSSGSAMDAYVHAGLVAAAYLQAKDEVNYKKWKDIENKEAKNAGIPAH